MKVMTSQQIRGKLHLKAKLSDKKIAHSNIGRSRKQQFCNSNIRSKKQINAMCNSIFTKKLLLNAANLLISKTAKSLISTQKHAPWLDFPPVKSSPYVLWQQILEI